VAVGDLGDDHKLRDPLPQLSPPARDRLRTVLIREQADRDAISSRLLRYGDGHGDDWAEIIDMLTMNPEARRNVVRMHGEIDASEPGLDEGYDWVECAGCDCGWQVPHYAAESIE
jgi:hypothetical protein